MANFSNREIYRVESDTLVFITQLPGTGSLGFLAVVGDYLMATAFNNHKIYTVDPIAQTADLYSGASAGHVNGSITDALFTTPNGIVANATNDTLYVSEYNTRRLRMITDFTANVTEPQMTISYSLFPNPVMESIHVQTEIIDSPYSVFIMNIEGKLLIQMNDITKSSVEVDVSKLKSGTYFLMIETENYKSKAEQFIKSE